MFSILLFSTIITLFLTSIQIYIDYKKGVDGIYNTVDQIQATQLKSLAQNLWNINNEQIQIQLKGLLEINTIKALTIFPKDDKAISLTKGGPSSSDIINTYPIYYERNGVKNHLGHLEVISDLSPVIEDLKSRILIILATQGAKTFIVSLFILFIVNILINHKLMKINRFAREIGLDNMDNPLDLSRSPNETRDEIDDLADSLNLMQSKIANQLRENKKFQDQVMQSQKMEALGTLASGVAHDFNNILQGLYNSLFIIEEEVIDNADALNHLSVAGHLVDRASELVKQILIYTKEETIAFKTFAPVPAVQDVINIMRAAKNNKTKINLFLDSPRGKISGNETQLKQVVLNLGNNALYAVENSENPKVSIKIDSVILNPSRNDKATPGTYLRISVQDNGMGMTEEVRKRIFEPFFTTKDIDRGTGLGLSVVQGIVEKHNGILEVESQPGLGTCFRVMIPLVKEETIQQEFNYSGAEDIILISNDSKIQNLFVSYTQYMNLDFQCFNDADAGLQAVKKAPEKSIVIVDNKIDNFGPEEFIRKIRQVDSKRPIIYIKEEATLPPYSLRVTTLTRDKFEALYQELKEGDSSKVNQNIPKLLQIPSEN